MLNLERFRKVGIAVLALVLLISTTVLAAPYGSRTMSPGTFGGDVVELQRRLLTLGYGPGTADGAFGTRTREALTRFQKDYGLVPDGIAGKWTISAVDRAYTWLYGWDYTVARGDSLWGVTTRYGIDAEKVRWLNLLQDDMLYPGQVLRLPSGPKAPKPAPAPVAVTPQPVSPPQAPKPSGQPAPAQVPAPGAGSSSVSPAPATTTVPNPAPAPAPAGTPTPGAPTPATAPVPAPAPAATPAPAPAPISGLPVPPPSPEHAGLPVPPAWALPWSLPAPTSIPLPAETPAPTGASPELPAPNTPVTSAPATAEPAPALPVPSGGYKLLGYYAEDWQGDSRSLSSLRNSLGQVNLIANFQMYVDADGNITTREYPELAAEAAKQGVPVLGLVHNLNANGFDTGIARAILSDPALRAKVEGNIVAVAKIQRLSGINIDIENVPPDQRANYTAFVQELSVLLKAEGMTLTLSIPAKTYDDKVSSWSGAFDYKALGAVADYVIPMAYDEHLPGYAAGPVASTAWVDRVAAFAASQIPPQKVLLGVPAYAYDWLKGSTDGRGLSVPGAQKQALAAGAAIEWDAVNMVPFYNYVGGGQERIVYFENGQSMAPKLDIVRKYGLGGAALWRLGLEDPGIWSVIREKLR